MKAGVVALTSMLLHAASAQAAAPPVASVGQALADKLEVALRTCALQLTRRDFLDAKNRAELSEQGITLAPPPPAVQAMASRLFGDKGIYASVTAPQGQLWIAASATVPACKTTLADTELALTGRYNLVTKLRSTTAWRFDANRSGNQGPVVRDFFVLNPDRTGPHMIAFLDGPNSIANQGKGIQLIMTVAVEATAKAP
jgi:hypothetical protein